MIDIEEVNPPANPCDDCIKNNAVSLAPSHGNLKFVYCVHNHAGGIWMRNESGGVWQVYSPIIMDDFTNVVTDLSTTFLHTLKNEDKLLSRKH